MRPSVLRQLTGDLVVRQPPKIVFNLFALFPRRSAFSSEGGFRPEVTDPFSGYDYGEFAGTAAPVSCTAELLILPSSHD